MTHSVTKFWAGGRVVIPAAHRKALGLETGDELILILENGEVRITSLRESIKRVQALVKQYVPEGTLVSEELLAERRAETLSE
jgi:AbrB family looped-hinge helix DNA binding protein